MSEMISKQLIFGKIIDDKQVSTTSMNVKGDSSSTSLKNVGESIKTLMNGEYNLNAKSIFSLDENSSGAEEPPVKDGIGSSDHWDYTIIGDNIRLNSYKGEETILDIPEQLRVEETGKVYTVTTLGDGANNIFSNVEVIEVVIPNTVNTISEFAFYENAKLRKVTLGENITTLPNGAFRDCRHLSEINLENVTTLSSSAFYRCTNLKGDILSGSSVETIEQNAFAYCSFDEVILPKTLKSINSNALSNCKLFSKIQYENEELGDTLESDFADLTVVYSENAELPVYEDVIGSYKNWDYVISDDGEGIYLTNYKGGIDDGTLIIPNKLELENGTILNIHRVGTNSETEDNCSVFEIYECPSPTKIIVSGGLVIIGENAFSYADEVFEIQLPNSISRLSESSFAICRQLYKVTLSNRMRALPKNAFKDCNELKIINLDNIVTIGDNAFQSCENLDGDVLVGSKVKTIGYRAFAYNSFIEFILPKTVSSIDTSALYSCKNLSKIQYENIDLKATLDKSFKSYNPVHTQNAVYPVYEEVIGESKDWQYSFEYNGLGVSLEKFKGDILGDTLTLPTKLRLENGTIINVYGVGENTTLNGTPIFQASNPNCAKVKKVIMPQKLLYLRKRVLDGNNHVEEFIMSNNIKTIDESMFRECANLRKVIISDKIDDIYSKVFYNCPKLEEVNLDHVLYLGNYCFYNTNFSDKNIFVNSTLIEMGDYCFTNCSFEELIIPKHLIIIDKNCFSGMNNIQKIYVEPTNEDVYNTLQKVYGDKVVHELPTTR